MPLSAVPVLKPRVMVVGDSSAPEFAASLVWLEERATLTHVRDNRDVLPLLETQAWEMIVITQSRPGQILTTWIEDLHRAAPLARLVALLGSWCEGEVRSGTPWPGVLRLYWHQFVDRVEREWFGPRGPSEAWASPRTATDADRLLRSSNSSQLAGANGLAVIRSGQFVTYEGLADALKSAGWSTVWWAPHTPLQCSEARALVWDFASLQPEELAAFRTARRFLPLAATLALVGFPRYDNLQLLNDYGAQAVISKPFWVGDLTHRLARLSPPQSDRKPIPKRRITA